MNTMTAETVRLLWNYEPESGVFNWKIKPHSHIDAGEIAGTINFQGHRILCFKGKKYRAARLAWIFMTGEWPKIEIDHIDCNQENDRWNNLREAVRSEQLCNTRTRKDNALGIKGVCLDKWGKYVAYICFRGKRKNLGRYKTAAEAKAVYDATAAEWHKEFQRAA